MDHLCAPRFSHIHFWYEVGTLKIGENIPYVSGEEFALDPRRRIRTGQVHFSIILYRICLFQNIREVLKLWKGFAQVLTPMFRKL